MKKIWLIFHTFLLALCVAAWAAGADNLFGVVLLAIVLMSFPLNLLVGWLFFAFDSVIAFPGLMLVMAFVMTAVGYLQWFELIPRLMRSFHRISGSELPAKLAGPNDASRIIESGTSQTAQDWAAAPDDKEKYSPVERVFAKETE